MSDGPRIIAGDDTFRIVRQASGEKVTYVVEIADSCDALGVERWKEVSADGKVVRSMRDFIIRAALQQEHTNADQS
jgi:hypothetical protein